MNPTPRPTKPMSQAWLVALQIAIILASIALSLFSQVRVAALVGPFIAGSLANCALMFRREWKSGRLSLTPGQLLQRTQAGERFPRQTLGIAAAVASCIAQWHVSMG